MNDLPHTQREISREKRSVPWEKGRLRASPDQVPGKPLAAGQSLRRRLSASATPGLHAPRASLPQSSLHDVKQRTLGLNPRADPRIESGGKRHLTQIDGRTMILQVSRPWEIRARCTLTHPVPRAPPDFRSQRGRASVITITVSIFPFSRRVFPQNSLSPFSRTVKADSGP